MGLKVGVFEQNVLTLQFYATLNIANGLESVNLSLQKKGVIYNPKAYLIELAN